MLHLVLQISYSILVYVPKIMQIDKVIAQ